MTPSPSEGLIIATAHLADVAATAHLSDVASAASPVLARGARLHPGARRAVAVAEHEAPQTVALAEVLSFALILDGRLVRAARRRFLPSAPPGLEADLRFSVLVGATTSRGFIFRPGVDTVLRERLAVDPDRYEAAWSLVLSEHSWVSGLTRMVEELRYLTHSKRQERRSRLRFLVARTRVEAGGDDRLLAWLRHTVEGLPGDLQADARLEPLVAQPHISKPFAITSDIRGLAAPVTATVSLIARPSDGPAEQHLNLRLEIRPAHKPRQARGFDGVVARHEDVLPSINPWAALAGSTETVAERLGAVGRALGNVIYGGAVGASLAAAIDSTPAGSFVELGVQLDDGIDDVAVELAVMPDGRCPALEAKVRLHRVAGSPPPPLPGPLKVLVAAAAPEETRSANPPLDVEAELEAVLLGVDDGGGSTQVRILEVASLAEIERALQDDVYHVLHLSGHGWSDGIELEDEDGSPHLVDASALVAAIRGAGRRLPLVFLSTCHSGARGLHSGGTSFATALVDGGVGCVIAMQTAVTDAYATQLARAVHRELAQPGATPAGALAIARQKIETERRAAATAKRSTRPRPEWGVPTVIGSATQPLIDPTTLPSDLPPRSPNAPLGPVPSRAVGHLIGRRTALRKVLRALRDDPISIDAHGKVAGVQILGIAGVGKSALAGRVMTRLQEDGWAVAAVNGRWNSGGLFQSVVDAMAGAASPPHIRSLVDEIAASLDEGQRLRAVIGLLRQFPLLIVVDGAEENLDATGGTFRDQAFPGTLRALIDGRAYGRMLVTSRYRLPGFDDLLAVPLGPLSRFEVWRLIMRLPALRQLGPEEQTAIYRTVGGLPQVLEFVDALLQHGRSNYPAVAAKLRRLAEAAGVDPDGTDDLDEAVQSALALAARDVTLFELLAVLEVAVMETLLQLSISELPMGAGELAEVLGDEHETAVARDLRRLADLSLVIAAEDDTFLVHRWTARALRSAIPDADGWRQRSRRAADTRIRRLRTGEAGLDHAVDSVRNLADADDLDRAVALIAELTRLPLSARTRTAILGDVLPLITEQHPMFWPILDIEATALIEVGRGDAGLARYQRLLAHLERVAGDDPQSRDVQRDLSVSYERLGDVMVSAGNRADAEGFYSQSRVIAERLSATDPGNLNLQRDLSVIYERLGDLRAAEGHVDQADELYGHSADIARRIADANAEDSGLQRDLSISFERLGDRRVAIGQWEAALELFQISVELTQRHSNEEPDEIEGQRDLSVGYERIGDVIARISTTADAEDYMRRRLDIAERLVSLDPTSLSNQRHLSVAFSRLGDVMMAQNDGSGADALLRRAMAINELLVAADPRNPEVQRDLSVSYEKIGDLMVATESFAEAERLLRDSLVIAEQLANLDPTKVDFRRDLTVLHGKLAELMLSLGRTSEADEHSRQELTYANELAQRDASNLQSRRTLTVAWIRRGDVALATGDTRRAEQHFRDAITIAERLVAASGDISILERDLSICHQRLGDALVASGDTPDAERSYRSALAIAERHADRERPSAGWRDDLPISRDRLTDLSFALTERNEPDRSIDSRLAVARRITTLDRTQVSLKRDVTTVRFRRRELSATADLRDLRIFEFEEGRIPAFFAIGKLPVHLEMW